HRPRRRRRRADSRGRLLLGSAHGGGAGGVGSGRADLLVLCEGIRRRPPPRGGQGVTCPPRPPTGGRPRRPPAPPPEALVALLVWVPPGKKNPVRFAGPPRLFYTDSDRWLNLRALPLHVASASALLPDVRREGDSMTIPYASSKLWFGLVVVAVTTFL